MAEVMTRIILVLPAIIVLTGACECRAQGQPAAAPAAPPPVAAPVAPTPVPAPLAQPPAAAPANPAPAPAKNSPGQRCVQHTKSDQALDEVQTELKSLVRPTGPNLESVSYFIPAGASFQVAINEQFDPERRYFGYVEPSVERNNRKYVNMDGFIEGGAIGAIRIPDKDALVKANLVDPGTTLLTLRVPDSVGGFWRRVDLYIWTCAGEIAKYKSRLTMRASSSWYGAMVIWPVILLIYALAAVATKRTDVKTDVPLVRYFDPVYMTAGSDGKGSLSKLQILFFSMIVFGLLSYIVARTGVLSDLSPSILLLLGIAGVGSTAAKGTDEQKNRLSFENRSWLIRKGWLPEAGWAAVNKASWHDIITNDGGEFDVYRYQSCIFSLTVGGALLVGGVNELASFTIPETLLGILGLSQVVYIGGKLVSTSSVAELNDAITNVRVAEKSYNDASIVKPTADSAAAGAPLAQSSYVDYMNKAKDARILFESLTGRQVTDEQLKSSVAI
jgi:hypothetical protein